jgi:hypothetical protein
MGDDRLSNEDYERVQRQLCLLAGLVRDLPLGAFIARAERADGAGAVLHPTLYRKAHKKLAAIQRMAEALHEFQRSIPSGEEWAELEREQRAFEALERGL